MADQTAATQASVQEVKQQVQAAVETVIQTAAELAEKPGNLEVWQRFGYTDPKHTKAISGKAYSGTSPKPHWIIYKLTEAFGPIGIGWGFRVLEERYDAMGDVETLHVAKVQLWYRYNGERAEIEQFGATRAKYLTSSNKILVDEDAIKKSVTDALVKCASYVGVCADIFMGLWDDQKYVSEANQYYREQEHTQASTKQAAKAKQAEKPQQSENTQQTVPQSGPPVDAGIVMDTQMQIEQATKDAQLLDIARRLFKWSADRAIKESHAQELAKSLLFRRAELITAAESDQFKKMSGSFVRQKLCAEADASAAWGLARTRLGIVEQAAAS